jgi:phosphatidylserine/phosphatidylglycerophosphate/cardiolipin synthase-like enzyme
VAANTSRDIHAVGSSRAVLDLLRSLFALELLRPSKRLWIVSPWVSDIFVLDNSGRQYSTVCPEWPAGQIRLSAFLGTLISRGTQVIVVVNETSHNEDVVGRLQLASADMTDRLILIRRQDLHEKGILGDRFTLNGSMNLTYKGVHVNDEYLWYRCDPPSVEQRRLELENRWRDYLS